MLDSDFEHVRTQAIVGASLQAFPVETSDKLHELFDDTDTKTLSTAANMLYDISWNANNGFWVLRILANALSCDFDAQRLSVSLAKPVDQYNILHDDQCADIVANKLFNDMVWLKEKLSHYDTREAIVRQAYREIAKAQDNVAHAYADIVANKLFNDMVWLKEKLSHYDTREAIVRQAYREIAKAQDNVAHAYATINRNIANHDMVWLKEKLSHYDTREAIVRQAYREIAKAQDNVAHAYATINRNIANH